MKDAPQEGLAGRLARLFIDSRLTPLFIIASILVGIGAVLALPREEEPQIVVPMIDVMVAMPGATAKEIEQRITAPTERLIWEIPGVEYVYSTSSPGSALVIVRFKVGEDEERSIVRLSEKLRANLDKLPPGASQPLIRQRSIDDVPVLALTLSSSTVDQFLIRRVAAELEQELKEVADVSEVKLIGGQRRTVRVEVDPERALAFGVALSDITAALQAANSQLQSGSITQRNREFLVETGGFFEDGIAVAGVIVRTNQGRPVYVRDVADVIDDADEPSNYVFHGTASSVRPAVTISVAKRKGTNATALTERLLHKVEAAKGRIIPSDVEVTVTRNFGETAAEKSNELLLHMMIAILSVSLLIWLTLGRRESVIVAIAIPVTLALTLFVFFISGYTLNRVTLFALIFSIGILVDDAIVVVENIVRHYRLPQNSDRPVREIAVEAIAEVGNPTILATFAVIAAILPMGFVSGLMGPYMRPIPVGASAAMLFSLIVAFIVTPWASIRLLGREAAHDHAGEGWSTRLYRKAMWRVIHDDNVRRAFLVVLAGLLLASISLFALKVVRVKMLPFDNKSEFQIVIDMPEGTTLEWTAATARDIAAEVAKFEEVENYQIYTGTSAPYNFNGLVRHYFLRGGSNVADLQVNLKPKGERSLQSHAIAVKIRNAIAPVAKRYGANVKVSEVPPGPPVLQTLVAEVYGPDYERQMAVAKEIRRIFETTDGVVDVDSYMEDEQLRYRFVVDHAKAALTGVTAREITNTLRTALSGSPAGILHVATEREEVPILVRVPREQRSAISDLQSIRVRAATGALVPLGALVRIEPQPNEKSIYRKNLMPVVYVTADVAGAEESPVYAIAKLNEKLEKLVLPEGYVIERRVASQPFTTEKLAMKWDGEWHITYEVFRDLGIAFAVVLVLIYILVVGWFESFRVPLTIMAAIPFSLVGIIPAHAVMGAFFTATSMIGFIAGAGIVVRNSIILVDFIRLRVRQGMPLADAVIDAGAVRFRPMMLTAAAVVVGASVILFDPIFQGLALSLMAGEVASLLLSRVAVPVLYYLSERKKSRDELPDGSMQPAPADAA